MTNIVKYFARTKDRFFTRNGNGYTLVRGLSEKLKIRRPGEPKEPVKIPTPVVNNTVNLETNRYIFTSNRQGSFTNFSFKDVSYNMVTFKQVANLANSEPTLKNAGFEFIGTDNNLIIVNYGAEQSFTNFSWTFDVPLTVTEVDGSVVENITTKKYDKVVFRTSERTGSTPVTPEQPSIPTPVNNPVNRTVNTTLFTINLTDVNSIAHFVLGNVDILSPTPEVLVSKITELEPTLTAVLMNENKTVVITTKENNRFSNGRIIIQPGKFITIKDNKTSEEETFSYPGIVYTDFIISTEPNTIPTPPDSEDTEDEEDTTSPTTPGTPETGTTTPPSETDTGTPPGETEEETPPGNEEQEDPPSGTEEGTETEQPPEETDSGSETDGGGETDGNGEGEGTDDDTEDTELPPADPSGDVECGLEVTVNNLTVKDRYEVGTSPLHLERNEHGYYFDENYGTWVKAVQFFPGEPRDNRQAIIDFIKQVTYGELEVTFSEENNGYVITNLDNISAWSVLLSPLCKPVTETLTAPDFDR